MDAKELIYKCHAVHLKEEEEDIVTFMGRKKIHGRENGCPLPCWKGAAYKKH